MRTVLTLAIINAVVWVAFIALFPGSHFAWPNSYKFWLFDDVPWVVLTVSLVVSLLTGLPRFRNVGGLKLGLIVVEATTLLALLPYAAFSGGGI